MSDKVLTFVTDDQWIKITLIIPSNKRISKERLEQFLKKVEIFFNRTNCFEVKKRDGYLLVFKDNQFTIDAYQQLWSIYIGQEKKQLDPIPEWLGIEIVALSPKEEFDEFVSSEATMVS